MLSRSRNIIQNVTPLILNRENASRLGTGILLTAVSIGMNLLSPYIFGTAITLLTLSESMTLYGLSISPYALIGVYAGLWAMGMVVTTLRNWILTPINPLASKNLIELYLQSQMLQSLEHHRSTPLGDHENYINKAFGAMQNAVSQFFTQIFPTTAEVTIAAGFLSRWYGFQVGLSLGGILLLYTVFSMIAKKFVIEFRNQALKIGIATYNKLTKTLSNYETITAFGTAANQLLSSLTELKSVFDAIGKPSTLIDRFPNTKLVVQPQNAKIEFKNVCFRYSKDVPILNDVSFTIEAGTTVGIVGTTGSGKTTIGNLLFRHYEPDSGAIFINGQDTKSVGISSLRSAISIVRQEPVLFSGTLYDNIAYGGLSCPGGVSEADVWAAVEKACLTDYVKSLPLGLQTQVGESGTKVSGGEKQRIALARAILKNPSIYLLDEHTSALDSKTENAIQKKMGLDSKNPNKVTSVMIAHDLIALRNADNIIVLNKGKVVEQGTHPQLIAIPNGVYAQLWSEQNNPTSDAVVKIADEKLPHVAITINDEKSKRHLAGEARFKIFPPHTTDVFVELPGKPVAANNTLPTNSSS